MRIQYCSDLHMEFHENMRFMKSLPLEPVGDVFLCIKFAIMFFNPDRWRF